VASPLGFTEGGRHYYREVYLPALAEVVAPVDPWSLTTPSEFDAARAEGRLDDFTRRVGQRNAEAIGSCPLFAAYLDGQEPDSGTVAELGFAAGLGKRCFGLRTDIRQAGDDGAALNLQVEAFVMMSGGAIAGSLVELVALLAASPG
jgi:nucleoside 2-deoxyribosyltransferase